MADPSKKSDEMEGFLDDLSTLMFGNSRTESISGNACVSCGEDASEFEDSLSRKEYTISGLCQSCQDYIFGIEIEEEN